VISVGEASARVLADAKPLSAEMVDVGGAMGRVIAEPVVAAITSPPWDNSSMDGYAVMSADLERAPIRLRVVATIPAGGFAPRPLARGEAMRIMTGAPLPEGADTVVRFEDTDDGESEVEIRNLRDAARNVRRAGEDFKAGNELFTTGTELRPAQLGVLAAAGISRVAVHRRPRVAIVSSGDELVELEEFTPDLAGKRIVSANSVTLPALARAAGGLPVYIGIARDDPESLRELLATASGCDLIVTSAGISVGDLDHVRAVVAELGGELDFWKVRMRPGAPLAFGRLLGAPWLGLSGNPVSAMITFDLFARPLIRRLCGHTRLFRATIQVRVEERIEIVAPLTHFFRAILRRQENGTFTARLAGSQSSAVLTAMARANALIVIPHDQTVTEAGAVVRAIPLGDDLDLSDTLDIE
jgi:molybdopterin molybdotransferase